MTFITVTLFSILVLSMLMIVSLRIVRNRVSLDVPPIQMAKQIRNIELWVRSARLVAHDEGQDEWCSISMPVTYGIHVDIEERPGREYLLLICDDRFLTYASDLRKWLEQHRALAFKIVALPSKDYAAPQA